jgi:chromate reductase
MRVLAISGSLRSGAYSTRLARAAAELLPAGAKLELYDGLAEIPNYDQDLEDTAAPDAVEELRRRIDEADALLIVTPEYNAGIPGGLKNAIDWASRPHGESALAGKPAAIISSSPVPFGGVWANQQIRKAFTITGTPTVETELAIGKVDQKVAEDGSLTDDATREQIRSLLGELGELVETVTSELEQVAA